MHKIMLVRLLHHILLQGYANLASHMACPSVLECQEGPPSSSPHSIVMKVGLSDS